MSLYTPYNVAEPKPEEQQAIANNQQQFQPIWDEKQTRDQINNQRKYAHHYTENDNKQIQEHAAYYGLPFYEGEFNLIDALKQAGAGFFEGFTTFNLMEPADNEYEQIFRNLGHLAGFAPGIMATPLGLGAKGLNALKGVHATKRNALHSLAETARALNDKSIPMAGAKILTKHAKSIVKPIIGEVQKGRVGAASTAYDFLTGNMARHVMEGAFHLGAASSISAWQGGVDVMMDSFLHGAMAGGVFRGIGNLSLDKLGITSEGAQKFTRGMAGSLFMGLPTTMRGATTPEQVYEYVMGAYFGKSEMPWTHAKANKWFGKFRERMETDPKLNESYDIKMHPEWESVQPEVKPILEKMAETTWGKPEDNLLINSLIGKLNPERLEAELKEPVEIPGYEMEQFNENTGVATYKRKRGFLDKFKTRMTSGGAEGADRYFAEVMSELGAPVFHYSFEKHLPTAVRSKGEVVKLTESQLAEANKEMEKTSVNIDRPTGNLTDYVTDLIRRNWHVVKHAQSVYATAPIIKKGRNAMRVVDGGTGWGIDMAIRHKKNVFVFDSKQGSKETSDSWHQYNYNTGTFQRLQGDPPKPPKNWAGIGTREISDVAKKAIKSWLHSHYEGKEIALSKSEIEEVKRARAQGRTILKPILDRIDKEIKEVEEVIQYGESELAALREGARLANKPVPKTEEARLENEVAEMYKELERIEKERDVYINTEKEYVLDEDKGTIIAIHDLEGSPQTLDTSPGIGVDPTKTTIDFTRKYLSKAYDSIGDRALKGEMELNIAAQINLATSKLLPGKDAPNKINRSEELADSIESWVKKHAKIDLSLPTKARGELRQWMARQIWDQQVYYFGMRNGGRTIYELLTPQEILDGDKGASTGSGQAKNVFEPIKLLQRLYEEAGGKPETFALGVVDHISFKDKDSGKLIDMELMRFQEKVERDRRFQGDTYQEAKDYAQREYNKIKARLFNQMYKQHNMYYFSGRGDSDRMYFAKFHPMTAEARKAGIMKEVLKMADMEKAAFQQAIDFKQQFSSSTSKNRLNAKDAQELFNEGYMSNLLYDMAFNGFDVSSTSAIRASAKKMFSLDVKTKKPIGHWIQNSKGFNKRSQIWFTNGYEGDVDYLSNFKTENNNRIKMIDGADGRKKLGYILVDDLPESVRKEMEKDPKYSSFLGRKATELEENTDGSIIVENRTLQGINGDSGMADPHGQNKSFIVSPSSEHGAFLGKYMMHGAGDKMSKFMRDKGVNMIVHTSAAKQMGLRTVGKYEVAKRKGLTFDAPIYELDPSHVKYNYSVLSDSKLAKNQRVAKQLLAAVLDNTKTPFERATIKDLLQSIVGKRYDGTPEANKIYDDYISADKFGQEKSIDKVMRNLDNVGIERIVDGLRKPGNEIFTNRLFFYMINRQKEGLLEDYRAGEIGEHDFNDSMLELKSEMSAYKKKIEIARQWLKNNPKSREKNPLNAMFYDKDVRDYKMQVLKNFIVREVTRPRVENSIAARMRPYDKGLEIDLDGVNPRLKELNGKNGRKIFFLDNGYEQTIINTGVVGLGPKGDGKVTLGELWTKRKMPGYKQVDFQKLFRALALRVPMDSVSGAHVLEFRGFTGRQGYGVLLHGHVMKALGGADLDGDEAFVFFGGEKHGFKESWKKGFEDNVGEYYFKENGKEYVGDNKMSPLPKQLLNDLGLPPTNPDTKKPWTYRDFLTIKATQQERDLMNARGSMYAINERSRISEAAVRGRAQMGASAVMPKQLMADVHAMLANGGNPKTDMFTFKKQLGWDQATNKPIWKEFQVILSAKTHDKWRDYARELGRAQVAFSSDPMDELGLKAAEQWFMALHKAHFNIKLNEKQGKNWVTSKSLKKEDLTSWDLKGGLYGVVNNLNRAYWGRNYETGRRYTMQEIQELGEGLYTLDATQREHSFLPTIAEKMQPLDWSDNLIGRLNPKTFLETYQRINKAAEDPAYSDLMQLLNRTSFKVPEAKTLLQSIFTKSKLLKKHVLDENGDLVEVPDTFNLYDPLRRRLIAKDPDLFNEAIDRPNVNKPGGGIYIKRADLELADKMTGKGERMRRKILSEIARKAEDFFLNDMYNITTFDNVTRLYNKMTALEQAMIPDLHKFAAELKSSNYLLNRMRNRMAGLDLGQFTKAELDLINEFITDNKLSKLVPDSWKSSSKDKKSAVLDRATIDKKIVDFRKKHQLTKKQSLMLDYLILGSFKRGNLKSIKKLEGIQAGKDPVVKEVLSYLKQMASGTAVSKLGINSQVISNKALYDTIGGVTGLINESWRPLTESQIKYNQQRLLNAPKIIKDKTGIDYLEQDLIDKGTKEISTGLQGLKLGVEINDLKPEQRALAQELIGHITGKNNKFVENFPEVVRALLGKDLNILNKEDHNILNNWFRDIESGTIWQRIFGNKGPTELSKRHHWLFPKTINRELMRDDIQLMEENGLYIAKGGKVLTGKLMRPTQHVEMVQRWISRTMDAASEKSEEYVRLIKEKLLFVNSFKEGETLRQIAVREREYNYWTKSEDFRNAPKSARDRLDATEYTERYREIMKHHGDKLNEKYTVELDGERKEYTGREIVDRINKEYNEFFKEMHGFIRGKENWLSENKMLLGFHDKGKRVKEVDERRFMKYLLNSWRQGKDVTTEIGIDGLREVAHSMMIKMAQRAGNKELAKVLLNKPVTPTNILGGSFEYYFPHMHFNKRLAGEGLKRIVRRIEETPLSEFDADPKVALQKKNEYLESLVWKNKTLTGEWGFSENWNNFDEVIHHVSTKRDKKSDKIKWFSDLSKAGSQFSRTMHIPGWSIDATAPEGYARSLVNAYHKQLSQIFSRSIIEQMYKNMKPKWGHEQAVAWQNFMKLYVQDAIGNPAVIPESFLNDPTMKLRGTPYAWWADNNVEKRLNKILSSFGLTKADIPKNMQGVDVQQLRHWSNLEAQYEMAALLAHPKSMVTNIFGGTMHTVESAGWTNWRNARSIEWLKQNINSKWNSMQDVNDFVVRSGVFPEYMLYELGLSKEIKQGKNREFAEALARKMTKDPELSDITVQEIAKQYGIKDKFVQFASKFMTVPERMIRRDAFMAHYIQAWKRYGGAIKDPEHPFLIEQAKKGVQATQFLYSAPFRPAFARTALGKVMTRFQLWSWNAVRFRNDVFRQAKIYGLKPGTEAYKRYARTMQIDLFTFALANMFAYSLFETALPAPWNWMQDTADWIFGNEKERDRAFFGQWPKQLAPLQMVTPPIFRLLPTSMRAMIDDDWSKVSKYYVWTMFPFGRMVRDIAGPDNLIENPIRIMEKTTGFPLLQLQKKGSELKEDYETGKRKPPPTPGSGLSLFGFGDE